MRNAYRQQQLVTLLTCLQALVRTSRDGILAMDKHCRILAINDKFLAMWRVPRRVITMADGLQALHQIVKQLQTPVVVSTECSDLLAAPPLLSNAATVQLKDGRQLECKTEPIKENDTSLGWIWQCSDVAHGHRATQPVAYPIPTSADDALLIFDESGKIHHWNHAAERIFGYSHQEATSMSVHQLLDPHGDCLALLLDTGTTLEHRRCQALRNDKQPIEIEVSLSPLKVSGEWHVVAAVRDTATRMHSTQAAMVGLNRGLKVLSECNEAVIRAKHENKLLYNICKLLVCSGGYRMAWIGYVVSDKEKSVRPVASAGGGNLEGLDISWAETLQGRGPVADAICSGKTVVTEKVPLYPDATMRSNSAADWGYVSSVALPLVIGGRTTSVLNIYSDGSNTFDIQELQLLERLAANLSFGIAVLRARHEEQRIAAALHRSTSRLRHMAYHDPLTGLPNRFLIADRLEHALELARRNNTQVAVLFIDLDHFKDINDHLGHAVGDRLLKEVADRLQPYMREADTIARVGGDEFIVISEGLNDITYATTIAKKIINALQTPFIAEDQEILVGASIGISCYPKDGEDSATLLNNADEAMYRAKRHGRNFYQEYSEK